MTTIIFMLILFGVVSIPMGLLDYVRVGKIGKNVSQSTKTAKSIFKISVILAIVAWFVAGFLYVFYANANIHVSLLSINLILLIFEISIGLIGYMFFVWKGFQVSKKIKLSGNEPAEADLKAREALQKVRRLWLRLFMTFSAVVSLCVLDNIHI